MLKFIKVEQVIISLHARERFCKRVLGDTKLALKTKEVDTIIRQYLPSMVIDVAYQKFQNKGVTFVIRNQTLTTVMK